ncbi:hypothetical protein R80B4_00394 [Fibrobacteres bacterium R8-0-B4]
MCYNSARIKVFIVLSLTVLFYSCANQQSKQIEENVPVLPTETTQREGKIYQLSEKCLALLAYGLLSDDIFDVPFGGACKDIVSDTLADYLKDKKRAFKRWQISGVIPDKDTYVESNDYTNIGDNFHLLGELIYSRMLIGDLVCGKCGTLTLDNTIIQYGRNNVFVWRLRILHEIKHLLGEQRSLNFESLIRTESYKEMFSYLDTTLNIKRWCEEAEGSVQNLRPRLTSDYSKDDYLLRYYNTRCDGGIYESADGVLFNGDKTVLIRYPTSVQGAYTIPPNVKVIKNWAFMECVGLTSLIIPNSVTSVGEAAFFGCTGLISITAQNPIPPSVPHEVDVIVDKEKNRHTCLYVPKGSVNAYNTTKGWRDFECIEKIGEL